MATEIPSPRAEELWTREEFETMVRHGRVPGSKPSSLLLVAVALGVLTGAASIIAGVALIYWPAALIVGGIALLGVCLFFVDIPARREGNAEPS